MTDTPGDSAPAKSASIPADSFAHRLMLARAHAGHMSIREAAELTGLGRGAWTHWEKGGMPVDLDYVVETISEKLGVDPVWLLDGGALAESEPRRRRTRWSTVRPTHARQDDGDKIGGESWKATGYKPRTTIIPGTLTDRPMTVRPRDGRPNGRPPRTGPNPNTRRPVRL